MRESDIINALPKMPQRALYGVRHKFLQTARSLKADGEIVQKDVLAQVMLLLFISLLGSLFYKGQLYILHTRFWVFKTFFFSTFLEDSVTTDPCLRKLGPLIKSWMLEP